MDNPASTVGNGSPIKNSSPKSIRILCFGDSLTAGYSGYGYFHYPYAKQIQAKLKEHMLEKKPIVDVAGRSGDRVVDGLFLKRMKGMCAKAEHQPYDWIIVLGGTNDLGMGERADDIFEALKKVWKVALDTGANLLALSVLEAEYSSGDIVQRRNELNSLIAGHQGDRLHYLDLCAAVPYFSMNDTMKEMMWDDGLHLTRDGYEMMGDAIATKLLQLVNS